MSLAGVGLALRKTPGWVWGLLSGAAGAALVLLRLRQAERDEGAAEVRADVAEREAQKAKLAAEDAHLEVKVERATETSAAMGRARAEIDAATDAAVTDLEAMDPEQLEDWLVQDKRRREDKP